MIITGLCTILLYPNGIGPAHDHEAAYVQAFVDLLGTPWRGVMMAGFAAWTVKANTPAAVGVPPITPEETPSDKPAGRAPPVIVHSDQKRESKKPH